MLFEIFIIQLYIKRFLECKLYEKFNKKEALQIDNVVFEIVLYFLNIQNLMLFKWIFIYFITIF
jgi:hypothetical protein